MAVENQNNPVVEVHEDLPLIPKQSFFSSHRKGISRGVLIFSNTFFIAVLVSLVMNAFYEVKENIALFNSSEDSLSVADDFSDKSKIFTLAATAESAFLILFILAYRFIIMASKHNDHPDMSTVRVVGGNFAVSTLSTAIAMFFHAGIRIAISKYQNDLNPFLPTTGETRTFDPSEESSSSALSSVEPGYIWQGESNMWYTIKVIAFALASMANGYNVAAEKDVGYTLPSCRCS